MGFIKHTFRLGGIHPPQNKLSAGKKIETMELPKQMILSLSQNLGAPSSPVVSKGDWVKTGTLIAKSSGYVSSNLHSPVSGKVSKIEETMDVSGYKRMAIFIDVEGDEWEETIDRSDVLKREITLSSDEIVRKIHDLGIVGLGGATFPTQVKLVPVSNKKNEILIVNAVECEPYLTCDHALMLEKAEEILVGVQILMRATNVQKAVIGIEANKPDAINLLTNLSKSIIGVDVMPLKVKYPQGGEKQLIDAVIKRQVPSGALPIYTGAVVQNVGTVFAVYEAIQKNKPLIERVVTVTGKSVHKTSNLRVRIGTPVDLLLQAAGGLPPNSGKIIMGGPMMGKAIVSTEIPIVKGSSGILVLPKEESQRAEVENCIRCASCIDVCPMGLEPYLLEKVSDLQLWDKAENERVMDCIECGCCSYTCPSKRPILDYIRIGKSQVGAIIRSRK